MVSHHLAKSGGDRHCRSEDVFNLSCDLARPCDLRAIRSISR